MTSSCFSYASLRACAAASSSDSLSTAATVRDEPIPDLLDVVLRVVPGVVGLEAPLAGRDEVEPLLLVLLLLLLLDERVLEALPTPLRDELSSFRNASSSIPSWICFCLQ